MSNAFRVKNRLNLTPQATEPTGLELGDLWMDAEGTLKRWDGTASQDVGSGGVGSVDIMFADTFDATNISEYTTTGTVAVTDNVLEVIQGKKSLKITHTGGASAERIIPVDIKFRNKNVTFSFDVESDALSGNLTLTVVDETNTVTLINAESIQPQGSLDTSIKRSVSFIIPDDCEELKYIITAVSESGKISIIDNVVIELTQTAKMSTTIEVPVVTEWVDAGPITITATTTNPTKGTATIDSAKWRQVGDHYEVEYTYRQTTAGTAGSGEYRFSLPSGIEFDSSIPLSNALDSAGSSTLTVISKIGEGYTSTGGARGSSSIFATTSNTFRVVSLSVFSNLNVVNNSFYSLNSADLGYSFTLKFKGKNLQVTETQEVSLAQAVLKQESDSFVKALGNAGQAITTDVTDIPFILTSSQGNSLQWNGASVTILEDGIYTFTGGVAFTASVDRAIEVYKNGVRQFRVSEPGPRSTFEISHNDYLNTGDIISFRAAAAGGTLSNSAVFHNLNITKHGALKQLNVSENQKIEIPTSELRMEGASTRGTGSDSAIVRFDNIAKLRGDAFTIESTAALGTVITMKKKGKLDVSLNFHSGGNVGDVAITLNQATRTTATALASEIIATSVHNGTYTPTFNMSGEIFVNIGDVIRVAANGLPTANAKNSFNLSFQEQEVAVSVTNVLPQFSESDSSVRVDTANGYGSTGIKIRRFSTVRTNIGSAITYADNAIDGASFTVNETGLYHMSYTDELNSAQEIGISLNADATDRITNYGSIAKAKRLTVASADTNFATCSASSVYLQAGDVVRAHSSGTANGDQENAYFTISKVGKPNVTGVDVTPFAKIEYEVKQFIELRGANAFGSSSTGVARYTTLQLNTNNGLIQYTDSATLGGTFTALKPCEVEISASGNTTAGGSIFITRNATVLTAVTPDGIMSKSSYSTAGFVDASASFRINAGDIVRVHRDAGNVSGVDHVNIVATELRDAYQVIGGGIENTYSARIASGATLISESYPFIDSVASGGVGIYNITFKAGFFPVAPSGLITPDNTVGNGYGRVTATTSGASIVMVNTSASPTNMAFTLTVTRQGSDYRTPSKAIGLPAQRIAYIKDVKASGTSSGTFTSGAWQTRTLNTLTDPTGIVTSLASNQFVLPAGVYDIEATAPAYKVSRHQAKLTNVTDSTDSLIGDGAYVDSTDNSQSVSTICGRISITAAKTFEIQHRCQTSAATNGFGVSATFAVDEVFVQVKIVRVEE
jgi:hypothetical protein